MNSCWMHWVQARIALRQLQAFTGQNIASALCLPSKITANCQLLCMPTGPEQRSVGFQQSA